MHSSHLDRTIIRPRDGTGGIGWIALMLVFLMGCTTSVPEVTAPLDAFTAHLEERVPAWMHQYDEPGATIALLHHGDVVWMDAFGVADRATDRPMTVEAIFRAESISKPVTAWGIMHLVEQGRIDLDAPVEQYLGNWDLPETTHDERNVTVRRLLSNNAGMPLGSFGDEYPPNSPMPALRTYLSREAHLEDPPGTTFRYSNVGFHILQLVVENVTDSSFADYMRNVVLEPLGMHRSTFAWHDSLRPEHPTGYELDGSTVAPYAYPAQASGGLLAPVGDLARFVAAEMDAAVQPVLAPESVRALHTPQVAIPGLYGVVADGYGLGHFTETLPDGRRAVWHGGQGHGWMTHFHAVPATGDGIVILTNSQRSWPLMAHVLSAWAHWAGIGAVKMGRITTGTTVLWSIIGVLVAVAIFLAYRLGRDLIRGTRHWAPASPAGRTRRLLQAGLGVTVLAVLAWSAAQPYLMVTSIFPAAAPWGALALALLALLLVFSAACPRSPALEIS